MYHKAAIHGHACEIHVILRPCYLGYVYEIERIRSSKDLPLTTVMSTEDSLRLPAFDVDLRAAKDLTASIWINGPDNDSAIVGRGSEVSA